MVTNWQSPAESVQCSTMPCSTMPWSSFGIALMLLPLIRGTPAFAAPKPWTLDAIMDLKTVSDPQITADGSRVVYVVTGRDVHRNAYSSEIWVVPATGGVGQPLAAGRFSDAHPRWSGDGGVLAFLSRRDGMAQIYVVKTPNASPRKLTDSPEGVIDFKWSPDSRYIGYLAEDPNPERAAKRRTGDDAIVGGEGYTPTRLHIIPAEGGTERVLPPGGRHLLSFDWAPDGSKVVYAAQKSPAGRDAFHGHTFVIALASGRGVPLGVQPGQDPAPAYSPAATVLTLSPLRGD